MKTASSQTAVAQNRIATTSGVVEGTREPGSEIIIFRGISFAEPPIGDLLFAPPQPVRSWSGVRKADKFGPCAMQLPMFGDMSFRSNGRLVSLGEALPQPDGPILKLPMLPEQRDMGRVTGMPVLVLAARESVQINDGVHAMPGTRIDGAIQLIRSPPPSARMGAYRLQNGGRKRSRTTRRRGRYGWLPDWLARYLNIR
jgi:Carboxylesterase family